MDMKSRALEQVAAAGKQGLLFEPGWESVTLTELVDAGLVWQQIVRKQAAGFDEETLAEFAEIERTNRRR